VPGPVAVMDPEVKQGFAFYLREAKGYQVSVR
jgi:hypothetical protein